MSFDLLYSLNKFIASSALSALTGVTSLLVHPVKRVAIIPVDTNPTTNLFVNFILFSFTYIFSFIKHNINNSIFQH